MACKEFATVHFPSHSLHPQCSSVSSFEILTVPRRTRLSHVDKRGSMALHWHKGHSLPETWEIPRAEQRQESWRSMREASHPSESEYSLAARDSWRQRLCSVKKKIYKVKAANEGATRTGEVMARTLLSTAMRQNLYQCCQEINSVKLHLTTHINKDATV